MMDEPHDRSMAGEHWRVAEAGYDYAYECGGATIRVGVRCGGLTREPRVRWQLGGRCGQRGYVHFEGTHPTIRLEGGERARLNGETVSELPVSRDLGTQLDAACEKLGTVVTQSARIGTDPGAFPIEIAGFERSGWDPNRAVLWYWRDPRSPPRAYQIKRGELVFRAQEWADTAGSETQLHERHHLESVN